jgi:fatty acid amide hydrolase
MWKDKNLDFIICPGFGSQAQKHGYSKFCNLAAAYTFVWNVLEMVAGTIPITRVREDEEVYGNYHNDPANHYLIENVKGSRGLPVGVQVIGLPYQEEKVLGLMKVI